MRKRWTLAIFVLYLLLLLDLTLFQFPEVNPPPNFWPFQTIARDMHAGSDGFLLNFVGNLVAFLPFGFLTRMIWPAHFSALRVMLAAAILSGSIELAQYASGRRTADVDDVIMNVASALIGSAAFAALRLPDGH